jgi:hypothetical protein
MPHIPAKFETPSTIMTPRDCLLYNAYLLEERLNSTQWQGTAMQEDFRKAIEVYKEAARTL